MVKKRLRVICGLVLAVLCLWGFSMVLLPLESQEMRTRLELWRSGVRSVQMGTLHGFLRDHCESGSADCTCVAMIHGLGDNALTWRKVLEWPREEWTKKGLAQGVKLYAVDLPGSGTSPAPADVSEYRVRNQAHLLQTVLRPICANWVILGNSFGGWVASWLALDWPEGVARLLLLSPAGFKGSGEAQSYASSLLREPTVEAMKEFQKRAYFRPRSIPDRVWPAIVERAKRGNSKQVYLAQKEEDFLDSRFSSIRTPVMFLWGKADQIIPLTVGKEIRELDRSAIWREVSECGHLLQKECPGAVIQSLVDLLNFGMM